MNGKITALRGRYESAWLSPAFCRKIWGLKTKKRSKTITRRPRFITRRVIFITRRPRFITRKVLFITRRPRFITHILQKT